MIAWAIALIVVGVLVGIFAPVMFLVAAAGFVLLIVAVARRGRGAPSPNRPE